jgi:hypothetical protein
MPRDFIDGLGQKKSMTKSIYDLGSNSRTALICVAFSMSMLGCAMPMPASFDPGADRKQFSRDEYECERDARQIRGDACTQIEFYEKCLRSKGYEEIKGSARKGLCAQVF